jgi:branched-chain amino acid transport system permease protein
MVAIYSIVTMALDISVGYTGLLSVAQAAFYGIGAYSTALLSSKLGFPMLINVPIGIVTAAVIATLIALPALKVHEDYFVLTTFAFQVIIFNILNNWTSLTGGPAGIPGIPQPLLLGISFSSKTSFFCLVGVVAAISYFLLWRLVNSPFGRILKAIREDEIFAISLGKDVAMFKISVFIISASLASVGGSFFAYYVSFIDPTSFTVMESIFILSIVIIGGAGSLKGSIIGSLLLIFIPELLRFIGMPSSMAANIRQIFYGILLVLFMMFRPQGILGKFDLGKQSHEGGRKARDNARSK